MAEESGLLTSNEARFRTPLVVRNDVLGAFPGKVGKKYIHGCIRVVMSMAYFMQLPEHIHKNYPLARLTTIKTGGAADFYASAQDERQINSLLEWAGSQSLQVGVIGSGSNLLVADEGVQGLVVKLEGSLATIKQQGNRLICGGGARLPQVSARAASLGLSGIEFGISIPGTVGGAVKMNANAFGGTLSDTLEWAQVASVSGVVKKKPEELGFGYRTSSLGPNEIVIRASFALEKAGKEELKKTLGSIRASRREAQPSGIKTFGSTFKNPDGESAHGRSAGELLEAAGCKGLSVGGAGFSAKHANFIENNGAATTNDVLGLISEARSRVKDKFGIELEPEVQLIGESEAASRLRA